jgi:isopropylmalate/homocitrate/citramalate synthase
MSSFFNKIYNKQFILNTKNVFHLCNFVSQDKKQPSAKAIKTVIQETNQTFDEEEQKELFQEIRKSVKEHKSMKLDTANITKLVKDVVASKKQSKQLQDSKTANESFSFRKQTKKERESANEQGNQSMG